MARWPTVFFLINLQKYFIECKKGNKGELKKEQAQRELHQKILKGQSP